MGSEGEGGRGSVRAKKPPKRQLVMESSDDSEADEYRISSRQEAGTSSAGNAGAGRRGDADRSEATAVSVSSDKVPGAKPCGGDRSVVNKGGEPGSSSRPDPKRIRVESVREASSTSTSKSGNTGKTLPRGFPAWRLEKPEVRAGWVLDDDSDDDAGNVGRRRVKSSSGSKVKEKVLSLDDKKGRAELQKHEKRMPPKTDECKSVDSGKQDVIVVQGKKGLLKILPKNNKVTSDNGDGSILSENMKVDEDTTTNYIIPTKSGVLKLLPKKNNVVSETSDDKVHPKSIKVDGKTGDGKSKVQNSKVNKEAGDGKTLADKTKLDGEFNGETARIKKSALDMENVAGKLPPRKSKADGETSDSHKGYEEKNAALPALRKQDSNGEKKLVGKLLSPIMLRKSDPSVAGVSSGPKMNLQNSKPQLKISSPNQHKTLLSRKDESTKSSKHGKLKKRLLEHKGSPEHLTKKLKPEASELQGTSGSLKKHGNNNLRGGPRSKLKQDLRNQIKDMLLHNGWKIELRPRRNKDYEDSVYVSPQGTGYWSITKAYAAFQEQLQDQGHSSNLDNIELDASNAISKDDLAMLRRNIVKRRSKYKVDDAEKKSGDSRSRNSQAMFAGSRNKHQNMKDTVKANRRGHGLRVRGAHNKEDNMDDYAPYKWKLTIYSWMIDLGIVSEDSKVKYMNSKRTRAMLEGKITRNGIYCGCCSKILTVAKFELHAGSKEKQPYANIFLDDGKVSLLQCLLDAWEKHAQCEKKGFYKIDPGDDPDDDTCAICGDGGDLVCCDGCTSTFHLDCLGIKMPTAEWYCRNCICRFCGSAQEETSSLELLSCRQCSRKYHQTCASRTGRDSTEASISFDGFCSLGCRKIYKGLNKLLGVKNNLESGFSWSLVHCFADSQSTMPQKKARSAHCNSKTALAFSIMDECFEPHIDERSGINITHNVVYNCGSDFSRLDFSGFNTFILERGDEVISAASVRIHGTDIAEMPFIGTRDMYRHQGMCRRLFNAIESALGLLNVRKLVIPAVPELENTWTTVFGFKPVDPSKNKKIKSVNLLIMNGTGLLEKMLPRESTVDGQSTTMPADAVGCNKMDVEASGSLTPVHASRENNDGNDFKVQYHENPCPSTRNSVGLLSEDLPPASEENEVKENVEKASALTVMDVKMDILPVVDCQDNMQIKSEADDIQEGTFTETNGKLVAENTVTEQNDKHKFISSPSSSLAIHGTVDPCSLSYTEIGKGDSCPSTELSVEAAPITDETEPNLNINSLCTLSANENGRSCMVPVGVPSVTVDGKPYNHELKTTVADGNGQSSKEAKGSNDITNQVNETSADACRDKNTGEEYSASAVDHGVPMNAYTQKRNATKDNNDPLSPELEKSSMSMDMEKLNEAKSTETHKVEMKDGSNDAVVTTPTLDLSNEVFGEVMVKPAHTCGGGQLHGDDGMLSNGMEKDFASKKPVNA